jgi:hypothetical protein
MGKIQAWGKPKEPISESKLKIFAAFGYRVRADGTKLGERRNPTIPRPTMLTFMLKDANGNTRKLPNLSSDFATISHYFIERDMDIAPESLALCPFPSELPIPEPMPEVKPKKVKK